MGAGVGSRRGWPVGKMDAPSGTRGEAVFTSCNGF